MNNNRARSFMQVRRSRSRSKRGVSPVIGVILMVAATIVIAGVVMAMLGGFGPVRRTYTVSAAATTSANGSIVYVTYHGGPDAEFVTDINCTINGEDKPMSATVGNTTSGTGHPGPGNDHVVVTAKFSDGSSQVILDTYV